MAAAMSIRLIGQLPCDIMQLMFTHKILLVLLVGLLLGQSVLTSADVHLIFEQKNAHHLEHDGANDADHAAVDDCGHSCHSHSLNLLLSQAHQSAVSPHHSNPSRYKLCYLSCSTSPLFRPPIA